MIFCFSSFQPGSSMAQPRAGSNVIRFESNAATARPLRLSVLLGIEMFGIEVV